MRDFEPEALAAELKLAVIYGEDPRCHGAVHRIASILKKSQWTVRDVFEGKIKVSLPFLHAMVMATSGAVSWPLEPEGFRLVPDSSQIVPVKGAEQEFTDVVLKLAEAIQKLRDAVSPASDGGEALTRAEALPIETLLDEAEHELAEARAAVKNLRSDKGRRMVPVA